MGQEGEGTGEVGKEGAANAAENASARWFTACIENANSLCCSPAPVTCTGEG